MKTAMEELIERLEQFKTAWQGSESTSQFVTAAYSVAITHAKELQTRERQQLIAAFVSGDERGTGEIPFTAEQYISQTYND